MRTPARHRIALAALSSALACVGALTDAHAQVVPSPVASATTITLTDGSVVSGVVVSMSAGVDVTLRQPDGYERTIPWSRIAIADRPLVPNVHVAITVGAPANVAAPTPPPLPPPPPATDPELDLYRTELPGTVPVVIDHQGTPLDVARITGTHTDSEPYSTRYGTYTRPVLREDTEHLCTTPCTLFLPPEGATLHFDGPGLIGNNLTLRPGETGERVRIAGASAFRPMGGFLLSFFMIPIALTGGIVSGAAIADAASSHPSGDAGALGAVGAVALGVGLPLSFLGVYLMATGSTRVVQHEPLRLGTHGPELLGASVAPSASGRGAVASVGFAF